MYFHFERCNAIHATPVDFEEKALFDGVTSLPETASFEKKKIIMIHRIAFVGTKDIIPLTCTVLFNYLNRCGMNHFIQKHEK